MGDGFMYDKKNMMEELIDSESRFNEKYDILLKEVGSYVKNELLAMVGAKFYCSLITEQDSSDILPALLEYIVGICLTSENNGNNKVDKAQLKK